MNVFIWLSAADSETLADCPKWEKRKYEALGMAVLVPVIFGAIASCYTVSTLTDYKPVIFGFPIIWAFIIMSIDRILLATYRAFSSAWKKTVQFVVRFLVAALMGLTISHPLTLLIFKDTITLEIEKGKQKQINSLVEGLDGRKEKLNVSIEKVSQLLKEQQAEYNSTIGSVYTKQTIDNSEISSDIDKQIVEAEGKLDREIKRLNSLKSDYQLEISGKNGKAGVGPAARRIADEIVTVQNSVSGLTRIANSLQTDKMKIIEQKLVASQELAKVEAGNIQKFNVKKEERAAELKVLIANTSKELERLRGEAGELSNYAGEKVNKAENQAMGDILQRTLALHGLFHQEGGTFALVVYVIITLLFSTIDTVPLIAKFFSSPGIYDERVRKAEEEEGAINSITVEIIDVTKPIRDRVTLS